MPRIRSIKPDFFKDEHIASLTVTERLCFVGLWCCADRAGRMEYRPKYLHIELFPYEPRVEMEKLLIGLSSGDHPFIQIYEVGGKKYIQIINFDKHQRPHHTERDSEFPDPSSGVTVKEPLLDGESRVGREGKGREGKCGVDLIPFEVIVADLNKKANSNYRHDSKTTMACIRARWSEGHREADFYKVNADKCAEWLNDPMMSKFLRPDTLYGNKFEIYLNKPGKPKAKARGYENKISADDPSLQQFIKDRAELKAKAKEKNHEGNNGKEAEKTGSADSRGERGGVGAGVNPKDVPHLEK